MTESCIVGSHVWLCQQLAMYDRFGQISQSCLNFLIYESHQNNDVGLKMKGIEFILPYFDKKVPHKWHLYFTKIGGEGGRRGQQLVQETCSLITYNAKCWLLRTHTHTHTNSCICPECLPEHIYFHFVNAVNFWYRFSDSRIDQIG